MEDFIGKKQNGKYFIDIIKAVNWEEVNKIIIEKGEYKEDNVALCTFHMKDGKQIEIGDLDSDINYFHCVRDVYKLKEYFDDSEK